MYEMHSHGLIFNKISRQVRALCSSMIKCSDKVRGSPHFRNEMILSQNYRKKDEMQHFIGSNKRFLSTEITASKLLQARSGVTNNFSFTSQIAIIRSGAWFRKWFLYFLLYIQIFIKWLQNTHVLPVDRGDTDSTMRASLDRSGPNYIHGPLFMKVYMSPFVYDDPFPWSEE
jgi:hypothetical protein